MPPEEAARHTLALALWAPRSVCRESSSNSLPNVTAVSNATGMIPINHLTVAHREGCVSNLTQHI